MMTMAIRGARDKVGEKYMEQTSPSEKDTLKIFESQIRECYARVVYSHKAHEKCADICVSLLKRIKFFQIILAAATSGSFLVTVLGDGHLTTIIGGIFSALLLGLNLYNKNYDLGEIAQKHKNAADQLWNIREYYLSLLTDILSQKVSVEEIRIKRDGLQKELSFIYSSSPRTNYKGYRSAQKALKDQEDMTFSDEEIDKLLPNLLRKNIHD
jgi:hypothetical protein